MSEKFVARAESREVRRIFPLLKDLFEYAMSKGFDASSFSAYSNEGGVPNRFAIPLPAKFDALVQKYPATYFVVAYEDRQGAYYVEGTRGRIVRLSTVPIRAASDERIREIDFKEGDSTQGNAVEVCVTESVQNESRSRINQASGVEVEQPHGSAAYTYELDPNGKETAKKVVYERLDEGIFPWKEKRQAVRWLRRLEIVTGKNDAVQAVYEDSYIIGRHQESGRDECSQIKTTIVGQLDNPQSVLVEIGLGGPPLGRVIYTDPKRNIRVIEYDPIGGYKSQREIIRQDPNYASLLESTPDLSRIIEVIRSKVAVLQREWDKPQNVFSEVNLELEDPKKLLNS